MWCLRYSPLEPFRPCPKGVSTQKMVSLSYSRLKLLVGLPAWMSFPCLGRRSGVRPSKPSVAGFRASCIIENEKTDVAEHPRNPATSAYSSTSLPATPSCFSSSHPTNIRRSPSNKALQATFLFYAFSSWIAITRMAITVRVEQGMGYPVLCPSSVVRV